MKLLLLSCIVALASAKTAMRGGAKVEDGPVQQAQLFKGVWEGTKDFTVCGETFYLVEEHTATTDTDCEKITECSEKHGAETYETKAPTRSSDRVCTAATQCGDGQHETRPASKTQDRICATHSECAAGQHETKAPTGSSDRECGANVCTCEHGYAKTGADCNQNGKATCSSCRASYKLNGDRCEENWHGKAIFTLSQGHFKGYDDWGTSEFKCRIELQGGGGYDQWTAEVHGRDPNFNHVVTLGAADWRGGIKTKITCEEVDTHYNDAAGDSGWDHWDVKFTGGNSAYTVYLDEGNGGGDGNRVEITTSLQHV